MGISGGKEGLSLYGVMNDAESIVGKRLLKRWFLQPTLDDAVLQWRQDVVALFLRPDLCHLTSKQLSLSHLTKQPARSIALMMAPRRKQLASPSTNRTIKSIQSIHQSITYLYWTKFFEIEVYHLSRLLCGITGNSRTSTFSVIFLFDVDP